ncbi:MAG: hypothetical protein AB1489_21425, partial [Acidobacteriota bacterium]
GAALGIAKKFDLDGNQAKLFANRLVRETTNFDILQVGGITHLVAENQQSKHYCVSDLAAQLGPDWNARKLNTLLAAQGFQEKEKNAKGRSSWIPTEKAKGHYVICDAGKRHTSTGAPVTALRWYNSILKLIDINTSNQKVVDGVDVAEREVELPLLTGIED